MKYTKLAITALFCALSLSQAWGMEDNASSRLDVLSVEIPQQVYTNIICNSETIEAALRTIASLRHTDRYRNDDQTIRQCVNALYNRFIVIPANTTDILFCVQFALLYA